MGKDIRHPRTRYRSPEETAKFVYHSSVIEGIPTTEERLVEIIRESREK
jgi:hypothetical protein